MNDADQELKAVFAELRRTDAAATPSFAPSVASVKPWEWTRFAPALMLVAAGLTLLLTVPRLLDHGFGQPADVVQLDLARARWVSPTDFLLDTPNSDLLRTMPRVLQPRIAGPPSENRQQDNNG